MNRILLVLTLLVLSGCASNEPRDNRPQSVAEQCEDRNGVLVLRGTRYHCMNKMQAQQMGLGRFP